MTKSMAWAVNIQDEPGTTFSSKIQGSAQKR